MRSKQHKPRSTERQRHVQAREEGASHWPPISESASWRVAVHFDGGNTVLWDLGVHVGRRLQAVEVRSAVHMRCPGNRLAVGHVRPTSWSGTVTHSRTITDAMYDILHTIIFMASYIVPQWLLWHRSVEEQ